MFAGAYDLATSDGTETLLGVKDGAVKLFVPSSGVGPSVKSYGATGDGTTDDSSAFRAAALSSNTEIGVPDGTYLISGVTINAVQKWTLSPSAIIKYSGAGGSAVTITGAGASISGGTIDCNNASGSNGVSLLARGASCRGVTVKNTGHIGIHSLNVADVVIEDNTVTNTAYIGIFCELLVSGDLNGPTIKNNTVDRSMLNPSSIVEGGIKIHSDVSDGLGNFIGGEVSCNTVLMPVSPSDNTSLCIEVWANAIPVFGNHTNKGSMGISLSGNDIDCSANMIWKPSNRGIEAAGGSGIIRDVRIRGNTIDGGVVVSSGVEDYTGCIMPLGIELSGVGAGRFIASDNTIKGATQYGIHVIDGSATADEFRANDSSANLSGNDITQAAGTLIRVEADRCTVVGGVLDGKSAGLSGISVAGVQDAKVIGTTIKNVTLYGVNGHSYTSGFDVDNVSLLGVHFDNVGSEAIFFNSDMGATLGSNIKAIGCTGLTAIGGCSDYDILDYANAVYAFRGTGTPGAVVASGPGSTFMSTDGGSGSTLYVKETGTDMSGWRAFARSSSFPADETLQWMKRLSTQPTLVQLAPYNKLIQTLVDGGAWDDLDAFWIVSAFSEDAAQINLVSSSFSTFSITGSPVFTADLGYLGGSGKYITTNFDPTTGGLKYARNDATIFGYGISGGATDGGIIDGHSVELYPKYSDGNAYYRMNGPEVPGAWAGDANGFMAITQASDQTNNIYRNSTLLLGNYLGSGSTALVSGDYILGRSGTDYYSGYVGCIGIGRFMTENKVLNVVQPALQQFFTDIGAI